MNNTTSATVGPTGYTYSANPAVYTSACPGGAAWTGWCGTYTHACASGNSYTYYVQETDGTFTSEVSAAFTYTCQ